MALFCGGSGSSTILRELIADSCLQVTVVVNGYDDGKSTGEMRRFLEGMLGPSDFRKNLGVLAGMHPTEAAALQGILEYRLPPGKSETTAAMLRSMVKGDNARNVPEDLSGAFLVLSPQRRRAFIGYIEHFLGYCNRRQQLPALEDCALGNVVFAGAYLVANRDFNASVCALAELCQVRAGLVNVTRGEARVLTALKADGEILYTEADIVGPQTCSPILDFFLLRRELTFPERKQLTRCGIAEKRRLLKSREEGVRLSAEAGEALRNADLIVYGPGTQFSSLFPSYRTKGLARAIQASHARAKVFITNLEHDYDIQELSAVNLVDRALDFLGDPHNDFQMITHVFCNDEKCNSILLAWPGNSPPIYNRISVIRRDFKTGQGRAVHCGRSVMAQLLELLEPHDPAEPRKEPGLSVGEVFQNVQHT